jgi:exodeoxyribonuclease V gamma subunit
VEAGLAGLFVHRAVQAEASAAALAQVVRQGAADDPMVPMRVAVGSRGMERWLRHRLARHLGIVANINFPFPAALLAEALGVGAVQAVWRPEAMTWRVLRWLQSAVDAPDAAALMQWLRARGRDPAVAVIDRDRYALARELADILDRVSLFRPSWVDVFDAGMPLPPHELPDAARFGWLAPAWRAVAHGVGASPPRLLQTATPQPGPPLHIFGVVSMPPLWWHAWTRVAEVREVHVFPILPTDAYIGDHRVRAELRRRTRGTDAIDVASQHPLLTALGRTARDAVDAYLDAEAHEVEVEPDRPSSLDEVPSTGGLLRWLQDDLREAVGGATLAARRASRAWTVDDDSVEVHGCHGATRQAEVLRDVLLRLFERHRHLEPRDVLILTPDVATFAPLVGAAFRQGVEAPRGHDEGGWGPAGGPRLSLHVADLGVHVLHPLAEVVLTVVDLAIAGARATLALRLAGLDPVRRRFGFDDDTLLALEAWMTSTGVRWGADAHARRDVVETEEGTFAAGRLRWALGVAMPDDDGVDWFGIAPWDEAASCEDAMGRWSEVWSHVLRAVGVFSQPQPLGVFLDAAADVVDALTTLAPERLWQRSEFADTLAAVRAEAAALDGATPQADPLLGPDAFRALFERRFQELRAGDRPITGAITLAALQPMRSVPFRVVVLLGMSEGAFPRAPSARTFDPLAASPRRGDRDPREEDRHLFLEAVGAAREHLIVLYASRDPNRDHPLPPAPPLADLLDALDVTAVDMTDGASPVPVRGRLVRQHPAQPYSTSAYGASSLSPSFDARWARAASALEQPRAPLHPVLSEGARLTPVEAPGTLALAALASWLVDPARRFMEARTGAATRRYEEAIATDVDPVDVDGLASWTIRQRWVVVAAMTPSGPDGREARYRKLAARGALPPGRIGAQIFDTVERELAAWWALADPRNGTSESVLLEAAVNGQTVAGRVAWVDGELRGAVPDDVRKPRHYLPFQASLHLAVAAGHAPRVARLVGFSEHRVETVSLQVPTQQEAMDTLATWLAWLPEVQRAPARVAPKTTAAFATQALATDGEAWRTAAEVSQKAWAAAENAWSGGFRVSVEASDPLYQRMFPHGPWASSSRARDPAFLRDARAIWGPLAKELA